MSEPTRCDWQTQEEVDVGPAVGQADITAIDAGCEMPVPTTNPQDNNADAPWTSDFFQKGVPASSDGEQVSTQQNSSKQHVESPQTRQATNQEASASSPGQGAQHGPHASKDAYQQQQTFNLISTFKRQQCNQYEEQQLSKEGCLHGTSTEQAYEHHSPGQLQSAQPGCNPALVKQGPYGVWRYRLPGEGGSSPQKTGESACLNHNKLNKTYSNSQQHCLPLDRPPHMQPLDVSCPEMIQRNFNENDPFQVYEESLLVLGEVEELIRQAAGRQPGSQMNPTDLGQVPSALLEALEDTISVVLDSRSEIDEILSCSSLPSYTSQQSRPSVVKSTTGCKRNPSQTGKPVASPSHSQRQSPGRPASGQHTKLAHRILSAGRTDPMRSPPPADYLRQLEARQAESGRKSVARLAADLHLVQQMRAKQSAAQQEHEQVLQQTEESLAALRLHKTRTNLAQKWLAFQGGLTHQKT